MRSGRRSHVLLLLVLFGLVTSGPATSAQSGDGEAPSDGAGAMWRLVDRALLVVDTNTTHLVTVWTDASEPDAIPRTPSPTFRLAVTTSANDTPVVPGPPLRLEGWPCPGDRCPSEPGADAGFLVIVTDNDDERLDGEYLWQPSSDQLDQSGTWRLRLSAAGASPTNGDTLDVHFVTRETAAWQDQLAALGTAFDTTLGRVALFIALLGLFVIATWIGAHIARRTVLSQRVDPTIRRLVIRLGSVIFLLFGLAFSLWIVWGLNFWAGLTALGLLSVALGFGMQNTVANLMGGINLAVDKPFVIGDRVQVGDTWGDVQEIGLRSTRILTTKHEVVIIPNKLLDEREIWNYTIQHPELRVDADVGISYDSDRRLAEALLLQAAAAHPDVLPYPKPRVLLQAFGESGVELQLRTWIPGAKDARPIASRIRKDIQDLFNANGVSIPFPHRTLVEHKSLPPPRRATAEELDELAVRDPRLPRMVYATAGPEPIRATADLIAHIAEQLDLAVVVLHVTPRTDPKHRKAAAQVLAAFRDAAAHHGVPIETIERVGDVVQAIRKTVDEQGADLLAIGSSRHSLVSSPRHVADLTRRIRAEVDVPILIVPRNLRINDRTLQHYGKLVGERQKRKRGEKGIEAHDDEAEERTDGADGADARAADDVAT